MAAQDDTPPDDFQPHPPSPGAQESFNALVVQTAVNLPPEQVKDLALNAPSHEDVLRATRSLFGRILIAANQTAEADTTMLAGKTTVREREAATRRISRVTNTAVTAAAGYKAAVALGAGEVDQDAEFAKAVRALSDGLTDALQKAVPPPPPTLDLEPGEYAEVDDDD